MSSANSSARTASANHLAQGQSRRKGSWNSCDAFDGSSTPRAHHPRDSSLNLSSSSQALDSSPPLLLHSTPDRSSSRDPSPTPTASATNLTSGFERWDTKGGIFYRYKAEYHREWMEWINTRSEYKSWFNSRPRSKRGPEHTREIKWGNLGVRSSTYWEHFQEGANIRGVPHLRCIYCSKLLQHPTRNGSKGMKDHWESEACRKVRLHKGKDPKIMEALRRQGEKVAGITRQQDLEIKAVITQDEWDMQLLRAFLSCGISFHAVTNVHLRATWKMLKKDLNIPCPTTLRRRLDVYYNSVKREIKNRIPKSTKVSLAIDSWTSPNHLAFLAIIGYFITPDWEYKEIMLGFENLPEGHTGKEQAQVVYDCLNRYGLVDQLGAVTSDNATVNETVNAELSKLLLEDEIPWDPVQNKIGCLAHTVQLILGVFIDSLKLKASNDTVPRSLRKGKISKVVAMAPGFKKVIEKVRQMSIAILASPQRNGYFLKLQEGREEICRSMIRDVSTRWNSTLQMLDRALSLKLYIWHWVQQYPAYRGLLLTEDEWRLVEDVLIILQPFRFYTLWISSSKSVTIHRSLEVYSSIILRLKGQLDELKHARLDWKVELRNAVSKALEYATRLWDNLDSVHISPENRPLYPDSNRCMPVREDTILDVAAVLDPFTKMENFRGWDNADEDDGYNMPEISWLESYRQRFIDYWKQHYASNLQPPQVQRKRRWAEAFADSDSDSESNAESNGRNSEQQIAELQKLVEKYLDSEPESILVTESDPEDLQSLVVNRGPAYKYVAKHFYRESILDWWAKNSDRKEFYPLTQMARDILATPAAAVACESAFSSGRDLCHYRRSKMKPETITKSMICKHYDRKTIDEDVEANADSNGASEQRAQRLETLELVASQFDVAINRKVLKRGLNDLAAHHSLTEGREEMHAALRKSLGQIEHDGEVEFDKLLPSLPPVKYTKAQPFLPQAVGNEEEESIEMQDRRALQKLPSVTWDEVSDFSSSDSEEESQRRTERQRERLKELEKRKFGLQKARRLRPAGLSLQGKHKRATRRKEHGDKLGQEEASRSSKLPKSTTPTMPTTPTRRREEGSAPLSTPRPRRVAALIQEGGYKV